MISDEERREVAKRLYRDYAVCVGDADGVAASIALGRCGIDTDRDGCVSPGAIKRLADLIDRPTCEMRDGALFNGRDEYGAICSNCGCVFEDESEAREFKFCPVCGADVVEGRASASRRSIEGA